MKNVVIFDLDGTVIDSSHRTPTRNDGTLDLESYIRLRSRKTIFQDTLFPLAKIMRQLAKSGNYIIISTARIIDQDDLDYLAEMDIPYHKIFSRPENDRSKDADLKLRTMRSFRNLKQFRDKPWFMFEDATPVIAAMRKAGVRCLNSVKVNEKLK